MNEKPAWATDRRSFLCGLGAASLAACWATRNVSAVTVPQRPSLDGLVGITTGGGLGLKRSRGELTLLSLPEYIHGTLGMKLIDVNTRWFESYDPGYLRRVRQAAETANCFFSNLKVNDPVSNRLYSGDANQRRQAFATCRRLIDTAQMLGTHWIRFTVPKSVAAQPIAHRELADYAEQRGIELLVENSGWMKSEPASIAAVVKAIGKNVRACPDTGNWSEDWNDDERQLALDKSFPGAASCDFKVWELDAEREHARYDLKRCFDSGWEAGFRGPWVIEYMQDDDNFARNTVFIRDLLRMWIRQKVEQVP